MINVFHFLFHLAQQKISLFDFHFPPPCLNETLMLFMLMFLFALHLRGSYKSTPQSRFQSHLACSDWVGFLPFSLSGANSNLFIVYNFHIFPLFLSLSFLLGISKEWKLRLRDLTRVATGYSVFWFSLVTLALVGRSVWMGKWLVFDVWIFFSSIPCD